MSQKGFISRTPLSSKKFICAYSWSFAWLVLIYVSINASVDISTVNAQIYICGSIQMAYLGGQSLVDTVVRSIKAKHGNKEKTNTEA